MAKKQRPSSSSSSSSSSQLWTIHLLLLFLVIRHAGAQPAIASPPRNGFNGSNLNPPSLAIIIVIVVTAFFFMGFFTIYIHQCAGGGSSTTSRSHRRGGLDPEIIDTFPTFLYSYVKDLKIGKGALECAVCLSEFEDEVTLRWLPKCDHVFHPDCIDSWLASHSTCPLCRSDLSATPTTNTTTTTTITPIFSNNEQEVDAVQFQNTSQSPSALTEINNNLVNETAENSGRVRGRFRRWHTTGHASSVVVVVEEGCDDCERFTLRLPEEVRRQIVESTAEAARMKRAKSCVDERGEGSVSSRRWWGRGEDRDRWLFFSRGASVKSPKITDGEGSASASASARGNSTRSFVTSVTAPFDCIGSRAEVEEATATTPNTDRLPV